MSAYDLLEQHLVDLSLGIVGSPKPWTNVCIALHKSAPPDSWDGTPGYGEPFTAGSAYERQVAAFVPSVDGQSDNELAVTFAVEPNGSYSHFSVLGVAAPYSAYGILEDPTYLAGSMTVPGYTVPSQDIPGATIPGHNQPGMWTPAVGTPPVPLSHVAVIEDPRVAGAWAGRHGSNQDYYYLQQQYYQGVPSGTTRTGQPRTNQRVADTTGSNTVFGSGLRGETVLDPDGFVNDFFTRPLANAQYYYSDTHFSWAGGEGPVPNNEQGTYIVRAGDHLGYQSSDYYPITVSYRQPPLGTRENVAYLHTCFLSQYYKERWNDMGYADSFHNDRIVISGYAPQTDLSDPTNPGLETDGTRYHYMHGEAYGYRRADVRPSEAPYGTPLGFQQQVQGFTYGYYNYSTGQGYTWYHWRTYLYGARADHIYAAGVGTVPGQTIVPAQYVPGQTVAPTVIPGRRTDPIVIPPQYTPALVVPGMGKVPLAYYPLARGAFDYPMVANSSGQLQIPAGFMKVRMD